MSSISFSTPILIHNEKKQGFNKTLCNSINFFESLFSWSGRHYEVTSSKSLNDKKIVELSKEKYKYTPLQKTLKVLSYLTLIIPIIAAVAKLLYRYIEKFELSKEDALVANLKLNISNLELKPKSIPIPELKDDIDVSMLPFMAMSLDVKPEYVANITALSEGNDANSDEIHLYLKAIIQGFNETDAGSELRKEILTNIGRDCGPDVCPGGKLKKIRKEFNRLYGLDADSVKEIILNEIYDLKIEVINQMANELSPRLGEAFHPHFINAFQMHLGNFLGLDIWEGARDAVSMGSAITPYFEGSGTSKIHNRFLEIYTPSLIVDMLYNSLNAKEDDYKIVLHLREYQKFIFSYLKENKYKEPLNMKDLLKGPLKNYAEVAIKELGEKNCKNLELIYTSALNELIKDTYFYFDEEICSCTKLKKEGCILILKTLGILEETN